MTNNCNESLTVKDGDPIPSTMMFSSGVVGNIVALVLLEVRRGKASPSLYLILVTALLLTDLLGSISVSPVVLTAYAREKTLLGMSAKKELCYYFGFTMTFLSLSTLAILCALALERYFSIGHPYFYERHMSKRFGYITLPLIFLGSITFCVAPLFGFGEYVQYCPGTWCFLVRMYRRRKVRRRGVSAHSRYRRSLSMTEEVEHLLPLAVITVVYICCTFPIVVRAVPLSCSKPCIIHLFISVEVQSLFMSVCLDNSVVFHCEISHRSSFTVLPLYHQPLGLHHPPPLHCESHLEEAAQTTRANMHVEEELSVPVDRGEILLCSSRGRERRMTADRRLDKLNGAPQARGVVSVRVWTEERLQTEQS